MVGNTEFIPTFNHLTITSLLGLPNQGASLLACGPGVFSYSPHLVISQTHELK